jgi:hypothetical protein
MKKSMRDVAKLIAAASGAVALRRAIAEQDVAYCHITPATALGESAVTSAFGQRWLRNNTGKYPVHRQGIINTLHELVSPTACNTCGRATP